MGIINTEGSARITEYANNILERYASFMPDGQYINNHVSWETKVEKCAAIGITIEGTVVCLLRDTAYFSINPIKLCNRNHDDKVEELTFGEQEYAPHLSTWSCGGVIAAPGRRPWAEIIEEYNKSLTFPRMCIIGVYEF